MPHRRYQGPGLIELERGEENHLCISLGHLARRKDCMNTLRWAGVGSSPCHGSEYGL